MSESSTSRAQVLDSRGNPTVEVEVASRVAGGTRHRAVGRVAPGSSRRSSCATAATAGWARACAGAVDVVNTEIADALVGIEALDQRASTAR